VKVRFKLDDRHAADILQSEKRYMSIKQLKNIRLSMISAKSATKRGQWILASIFCLLAFNLFAAKLEQKVEAADSLFLGSRFYLNITSDAELSDVIIPDSLSKFAILAKEALKIKRNPIGLKLTIAALDTGVHTFPSLIVKTVQTSNDTLRTQPFRLEILETRAPQDTTLVDIAPTHKLKGELPYFAYYLIAAILLFAFLVTFILLLRKYRKKKEEMQFEPLSKQDNRPNWKKALDALNALEEEKLPEKGEFIHYHYRLSEIMKLYLEAEYKFSANEMTTREIRQHFKKHRIIRAAEQKEIIEWLENCDKVKFAKHIPLVQDCVETLNWFKQFLNQRSTANGQDVPEDTESD